MMKQLHIQAWFALLALAVALTGCQKKCQQNSETLRTIIDTEFRLVQSSDPQVSNLTNTNFVIMVFKIDYTGEMFRVENNSRFNDPVLIFRYNVDPQRKLIQVQYYELPTEESAAAAATAGGDPALGAPVGNPRVYQYNLSNELTLREQGSGFRYRYVPFTGVVKPDEICKF